MERASGCNLWSVVATKSNVFSQYLSDGYCKSGPPPLCLSLQGQAPQISPVIPVRGDPSGLSGKHSAVLGELNFYFGFLLLPLPLHPPKAIGPGAISCGPVNYPENGQCSWSVDLLLTFVMLSFLVSVSPRGCSHLTPWVLEFSQ